MIEAANAQAKGVAQVNECTSKNVLDTHTRVLQDSTRAIPESLTSMTWP